MNPMTGIWHPKRSLSGIELAPAPIAVRVLILIGLGALLASLRDPPYLHLHLPGHQGLVYVAVMMLAARIVRLPGAATIIASGAALAAVMTPIHSLDPTGPLTSAVVVDFANRLAPEWDVNPVFMALVGAVANATKPLVFWTIMAASGLQFGSLAQGLAYPFAMHLAFGLGAGISAWILWTGFEFAQPTVKAKSPPSWG